MRCAGLESCVEIVKTIDCIPVTDAETTAVAPMSADKIWIARVDTRYEVIGVGRTERQAIDLACVKALEFLQNGDATREGVTDTVAGVEDYFGVWAQQIEIGTADYVGL